MAGCLINTMNRQDNYPSILLSYRVAIWITLYYSPFDSRCGLISEGVGIVFIRHPAVSVNILDGSDTNYLLYNQDIMKNLKRCPILKR